MHHKAKLASRLSSSKGFTLLELLVVISVISLIASLIIVSLHSATVKAVDTTVKSDLSSFVQAVNLYYQDKGDIPTLGLQDSGGYYECFWDIACGKFDPDYLKGYLSSQLPVGLNGYQIYYGYIAIPSSSDMYHGCAYGVIMANCICIAPGGMLIYAVLIDPKDAQDPNNTNWWDLPGYDSIYSVLTGNAWKGNCPPSAVNFFGYAPPQGRNLVELPKEFFIINIL